MENEIMMEAARVVAHAKNIGVECLLANAKEDEEKLFSLARKINRAREARKDEERENW